MEITSDISIREKLIRSGAIIPNGTQKESKSDTFIEKMYELISEKYYLTEIKAPEKIKYIYFSYIERIQDSIERLNEAYSIGITECVYKNILHILTYYKKLEQLIQVSYKNFEKPTFLAKNGFFSASKENKRNNP